MVKDGKRQGNYMHSSIIHLPDLKQGEEYVINTKKKSKKPKFTMTGDEMKSLDIIAQFSKPEALVFIKLKDNRDYISNITEFSTGSLSPTDKVRFSIGYKALEEKELVIRLKKGLPSIYLFNPDFIIPNDYETAKQKWNKRKNK